MSQQNRIDLGHKVGWLDGGARSGSWSARLRPLALICLLCLLLDVPGLVAIPPLDRDEARFAQATRQMLQTGDFLDIRFQNEERNKKPAGIYWLQAASVAAFSDPGSLAIWPYRLPSVLGATIAALLTFVLGVRLFETELGLYQARRTAFLGAVLLASALGVAVEAHIAKSDAALLAAIAAGQGVLGLAYVRSRGGGTLSGPLAAAFWIAEAAGIFLKGPVAPGLAALTAVVLSVADRDVRWLRGLRPLIGLVFVAAVVAPWLVAIEQATAGRFLQGSLGQDLLAKLLGGQEAHGAPPFYYLLLSLATFWPGSLFLVPALVRAWRSHEAPAERFLLAWIVPAWFLSELIPTKLPHYVLPLYPALALLVARSIAAGFSIERKTWVWIVDCGVRGLWAVVTLLLAVLLVALPLRFDDGVPLAAVAGGAAVVALGAMLWWRKAAAAPTAALAAAVSAVFVAAAGWVVLPSLDRLWLSRSAAAIIARLPPPSGLPIVAVGYSEPSLVFLVGSNIDLTTPGSAAETLARGGEALVSGREDAMFRQALSARHLAARRLDEVRGTDYSNGQRMVLTLYAVSPE
ncbi:MAG TPA: glycosyltransferase family 39 protein [Stellaceae bacterium]|nr:glycosyltransferase family 39 protein [Stellaceae bacterium]